MSATTASSRGPARRLSSFLAVASGKVVAQGALLACNVIVARQAGPAEFGMYAAALSLVLILDACAGAPLDYTVIRFSAMHGADRLRTEQVQALAFRIKLGVAAVLALLLWAVGPALARTLLHDPARVVLLWVAVAATAGLLLFRGTATFLQAQARFRTFAMLDGLSGALRIAAVGGAAILGVAVADGFLGALAFAYVMLVGGAVLLLPQPYFTATLPDRTDRRTIVRFLGATTGSIVLGTISGRSDLLFLTASAPAEVVSAYAAAGQLASIVTMLAGYASLVTQPLLIPALRDGSACRLLRESVLVGAGVGLAFWLAVAWSGDRLPSLLFGHLVGNALSGQLLAILAAGTAVDLICMPVAMTYVLQIRPRAALVTEMIMTTIFLAAAGTIVFLGSAMAAFEFAVLASGLRVIKTAVYVGLMARDVGWSGRGGQANNIRRPR